MNDALGGRGPSAAHAAQRDRITDTAIVSAAAAAALLAAHQASLVGLAGLAPSTTSGSSLRLFRGGRWPLGVVDGVYRVF